MDRVRRGHVDADQVALVFVDGSGRGLPEKNGETHDLCRAVDHEDEVLERRCQRKIFIV